jgi:MoxR-like ATPase
MATTLASLLTPPEPAAPSGAGLEAGLRAAGYVPRRGELLALRGLLARAGGARVLIVEGPPGTGKTALGRALASLLQAEVVYYLCHHWTSDEELHLGVDVGRVAAGVERPEDAYRPGALLRAVEASQRGTVVLIVDELDKAPERAEALLLEFLQTGRVHGPRGEVWQADLARLVVILTTNGLRPLMEPTLRRGFRLRMEFLPAEVEAHLLRQWTGAAPGVVRLVVRMLTLIRTKGATAPSLQEARYLLEDLRLAASAADCQLLIEGWLVKEPADGEALRGELGQPGAVLWGEVRRGR